MNNLNTLEFLHIDVNIPNDRGLRIKTFDELGLNSYQIDKIRQFIKNNRAGIIFVAGGIGSGKSNIIQNLMKEIKMTFGCKLIEVGSPVDIVNKTHPQIELTDYQLNLSDSVDEEIKKIRQYLSSFDVVVETGLPLENIQCLEFEVHLANTGRLVIIENIFCRSIEDAKEFFFGLPVSNEALENIKNKTMVILRSKEISESVDTDSPDYLKYSSEIYVGNEIFS